MCDAASLLHSALSGRYTIERELGRGGMATVYLGDDLKHDRKVAIKVLRSEVAASVGAARFLREVGIAARLSHPHIVPLIDSGNADGALYYVTPFIGGGSLQERLDREHKLPIKDALRIASEVGSGLDYVHRSGFVHRDIKPANILFADGHAMLADFGIAQVGASHDADSLTNPGVAVGTPEYMSPEQASGERDLESRSDMYSLSCVVYQMLAGVPPFTGPNARATMAKQVTGMQAPLRTLRADVPAGVESAVARGLAKDPQNRFSTVADFVSALLADSPATGRMPHDRMRSVAVLPFVNASPDAENEYLSDGITDELIAALAKVEGIRVASRTSVFALKAKQQDVRVTGALLGVSEVLEGTVRRSGDRLRITAQLTSTEDGSLVWSQRYDRKLVDVFEVQDELARTIVDTLRATSFSDISEPRPRRYTENLRAYALYLRGRYAWNKRNQEGISDAIACFEEAIAVDPNYTLAYAGLADSYALHVDYRSVPVREGFERAKAYARKAIELDESVAEAHASLAWTLFIFDWDWEESGREFRRAIELDPRYASAHQWYAFQLASQGMTEEAVAEGSTALELDPASVSVRRSLASANYYARRYEQSAYHAQRAIALNPTAEESYRVLGLSLAHQGELAEAERVLRESLELPGAGTYAVAWLGYVLARAGKHAEAEEQLERLELLARSDYVSPVAFAAVHIGLGQHSDALTWAERAYDERRGWLAYLNVNPMVDPLRGEKRFRALVRKMGL